MSVDLKKAVAESGLSFFTRGLLVLIAMVVPFFIFPLEVTAGASHATVRTVIVAALLIGHIASFAVFSTKGWDGLWAIGGIALYVAMIYSPHAYEPFITAIYPDNIATCVDPTTGQGYVCQPPTVLNDRFKYSIISLVMGIISGLMASSLRVARKAQEEVEASLRVKADVDGKIRLSDEQILQFLVALCARAGASLDAIEKNWIDQHRSMGMSWEHMLQDQAELLNPYSIQGAQQTVQALMQGQPQDPSGLQLSQVLKVAALAFRKSPPPKPGAKGKQQQTTAIATVRRQ